MGYLKSLSEIKKPSLTIYNFDGIVDEIIQVIKSDPNWNSLWDGELEQNASIMIIEFFSFLFKKNAEYFNRLIRENFIFSAKDSNSILSILSSLNIPIKQNTAGYVRVKCFLNNEALPSELILNAGYQLPARDINGNLITFEIYNKTENNKYDYLTPIIIPENESEFFLDAYAGETFKYEVVLTSEHTKNFIIEIPYSNIIEDSIRVYYDIANVNKELVKTFSFSRTRNPVFLPDFPNGIPFFKENFNADGKAFLIFGNENFGGNFATPENKVLTIFGRRGGGSVSNIVKYSINTSKVFTFSGNKTVTINFQNLENASGGSDRENIEELRNFAPLRTARENKIIDETDALLALNKLVQKHVIETPKPSLIDNKIQVFHYENRVAPLRKFSDFIFPTPSNFDTINSYNEKFLKALNNYLNLSGIRDQKVEDEFVTNFVDKIDFRYNLKQYPPLSGSIEIKAIDENGVIVDFLKFETNYKSEKINLPTKITSKAIIESFDEIKTTITINSSNNKLRFIMNEQPFGSGVVEEITITSSLYGFDSNGNHTDLANEINLRIKELPFYSNFINHTFCFAKNKKIYLQSPAVGEHSFIRILNTTNSIHNLIKFPLIETYAYPETGRIFLSKSENLNETCYYTHGEKIDLKESKAICNYSKNSNSIFIQSKINSIPIVLGMYVYGKGIPIDTIITNIDDDLITISNNTIEEGTNEILIFKYNKFSLRFLLNNERMQKQLETTTLGAWLNPNERTGMSKVIVLQNYNLSNYKLQLNSSIKIEAFDGLTKISEIEFPNIKNSSLNSAIFISGLDIWDLAKTNFDYSTSTILIKLKDADILASPPYGYNLLQGIEYTATTYFKISYKIKTYEYITCSYFPNPYVPVDEVKALSEILTSKERKMLCFLPIFRRVEFKPIKLSLSISKQRFKSASELYSEVFEFIQKNYSYFSQDVNFNIGNGFSIDYIKNSLISSGIKGIESIHFNTPSENIIDNEKNKFYFILSEDFINRMKILEENFPNLKGFSNLYSLDINISSI